MKNIKVTSTYERAIDSIVLNNRRSESIGSSLYYSKLYYDNFHKKEQPNLEKIVIKEDDIYKLNNNVNLYDKFIYNEPSNNTRNTLSPCVSQLKNPSLHMGRINQLKIAKNVEIILKPVSQSINSNQLINNNPSISPIRQRNVADIESINQLFFKGNATNENNKFSVKSLSHQKSSPDLYIRRDFTKSIAYNIVNKIDNLRPFLREKNH
jgi:hypothetical protein